MGKTTRSQLVAARERASNQRKSGRFVCWPGLSADGLGVQGSTAVPALHFTNRVFARDNLATVPVFHGQGVDLNYAYAASADRIIMKSALFR